MGNYRGIRMWLELLDFAIGIGFGYGHRGKEEYWAILRNSFVAGVVMSIILLVLSMVVLPAEFRSGAVFPGIFGLIVTIVIYIVIFIAGAFVGDQIESMFRK